MKKAIIFHGTGTSPDDFWFGWLKAELEQAGYAVELPHYPEINQEPLETFLPKVLAAHQVDDETVLIGHSAGAPLILSMLENINIMVAKALLIAGFVEPTGKFPAVILQKSYNWERIKQHAREFVFINSDNDPWGCNATQGRKLFDHLGGTLIIRHDGHFGSASFNQEYPTFPLLKTLILGETA